MNQTLMICYLIDLFSLSFSGWRKSLSNLEMTVEVLFGKQCELVGGKQSEELTPMRTLLLVKPADAHSVLQAVTPFSVAPRQTLGLPLPVTARVCPLEVAVFPGVHSAVHSAHLWTGWGTVFLS